MIMKTNVFTDYDGFLLVFNNESNGSVFFNSIDEAANTRDMVAGGGLIYYAKIVGEKGAKLPLRGQIVRRNDGRVL